MVVYLIMPAINVAVHSFFNYFINRAVLSRRKFSQIFM